ncbi:adenylate kinase 5, chloroplastic isoform X2 [Pistacia vera]|uniref:adenylate kinase 5, chloroplastic isoform X2 n=1 Tax=Pistacia vera TaxID=55513 RepID=UPI001263C11A|nr:adenylate kinase 5, chloroplastic isoform X2 [Pistacia vera]
MQPSSLLSSLHSSINLHSTPSLSLLPPSSSSSSSSSFLSFHSSSSLHFTPLNVSFSPLHATSPTKTKGLSFRVTCASTNQPLKVMISGAPASGKGTQCELIVQKVPDEILIDRCIGRKLDPVTGKIYHLKNFPPETEEIKARLVTRPDDTEEKVKSRLDIYKQNAKSISSTYSNIMKKVNGNRPKEMVFKDVESLLSQAQGEKVKTATSGKPALKSEDSWKGIPTRLNNIPHSREIRNYFYDDVLQATQRAVNDGRTRLRVDINIPELNPEMDVYRIGTLMELVRVLALSFADDGKRVKVCVQGSMGEGALAGMPLQLAGTRKILEFMDWGNEGAMGTFINIGSIGAKEVGEQDDMFILVAPQNAVGNCIIDDLRAMTDVAGQRPVILINPRLKDLPGSSGIMQTMGREERLVYAASFESCYFFRLLYYMGTQYPIMGALRMSYPYRYELYKRVDEAPGKEKYVILATFPEKPNSDEINDAFLGKPRNQAKKASGFWGFLSGVF